MFFTTVFDILITIFHILIRYVMFLLVIVVRYVLCFVLCLLLILVPSKSPPSKSPSTLNKNFAIVTPRVTNLRPRPLHKP